MDFLISKGINPPIKIYLKSPSTTVGTKKVSALKKLKYVSENHACFHFYDDSWFIEDLGSQYGVFVNNVRIGNHPKRLNFWDIIGLGVAFIEENGFLCVLCPKFLSFMPDEKVLDWNGYVKYAPEEDYDSGNTSDSDTISVMYLNHNGKFVQESSAENHRTRKRISKYKEKKNKADNKLNMKCIVRLVRCDSSNFKWPRGIKKVNFSKKNLNTPSKSMLLDPPCSSRKKRKPLPSSESSLHHVQSYPKSSKYDSEDSNSLHSESNIHSDASIGERSTKDADSFVEDSNSLHSESDILSDASNEEGSTKDADSFIEDSNSLHSESESDVHSDASVVSVNKVIYPSTSVNPKIEIKNKKISNAINKNEESKKNPKSTLIFAPKNITQIKKQKHTDSTFFGGRTNKVEKQCDENKIKNTRARRNSCKKNSKKFAKYKTSRQLASLKKYYRMLKEEKQPNSLDIEDKIRNLEDSARKTDKQLDNPSQKSLFRMKRKPDDYGNRLKFMLADMQSSNPVKKRDERNGKKRNSNEVEKKLNEPNYGFVANLKTNVTCNSEFKSASNNHSGVIPKNKQCLGRTRQQHLAQNIVNHIQEKSNLKPITNEPNYCLNKQLSVKDKAKEKNLITDKIDKYKDKTRHGKVETYENNSRKNLNSSNQKISTYEVKRMNCNLAESSNMDNSCVPTMNHIFYASGDVRNPSNHSPKRVFFVERMKTMNKNVRKQEIETKNNFYLEFIKAIVHLNIKWLEEMENCRGLPDVLSKNAKLLPLQFDSYSTYVSLYFPMIILESWEEICLHSKQILKNRMINKFYFYVVSFTYRGCLLKLQCQLLTNDEFHFVPSVKHLILLDLKLASGEVCSAFGFITKKEKITEINDLNCKLHLPPEWLINAKFINFCAYVKSRETSILTNVLMEGNGICSLENRSREADALSYLTSSALMEHILHPNLSFFAVSNMDFISKNHYFELQEWIANTIYSEIISTDKKIILLQGPPGSGKTNAILGIIKRMYSSDGLKKKILVTSPSDVAVDEIGYKMCNLLQSWDSTTHSPTFVRVGHPQHVHPKLVVHSLYYKLEKCQKNFLRNLNSEENLKELMKENYFSSRLDILKNVDVVFCTLNECDTLRILKDLHFSFCIIDEANQATELESLLPVMLGINKFIMFGDKMQLSPAIKSELAAQCGFDRSLFERLQLYFASQQLLNPTITLKEQYRMHSEIFYFPSNYFYNFEIVTPSVVDEKVTTFAFYPYTVFDCNAQVPNFSDIDGTAFIMALCSQILNMYPHDSIGIIATSEIEKCLYISSAIKQFKNASIEISTIDRFQGKSKQFVILSCFYKNDCNLTFFKCKKMFNVALTRAMKCLCICGPLEHLQIYPHWKALIYDAKKRKRYFKYNSNDECERVIKNVLKS